MMNFLKGQTNTMMYIINFLVGKADMLKKWLNDTHNSCFFATLILTIFPSFEFIEKLFYLIDIYWVQVLTSTTTAQTTNIKGATYITCSMVFASVFRGHAQP